MKQLSIILLLVIILSAGCSSQKKLTPPQFNLELKNLPPTKFIEDGQETSGSLANKKYKAPYPLVFIPPEVPDTITEVPTEPVILYIFVTSEGKVEDIKIIESPDIRLNDSVISSVKQWHFEPATNKKSGEKVDCWAPLPIYFNTL